MKVHISGESRALVFLASVFLNRASAVVVVVGVGVAVAEAVVG